MSSSPKIKSPPKVVSISLQSPQKNKKQSSPPAQKDPYNSSLSKLKKTFESSTNVYSQIQANHQQKIFLHEQQKIRQKQLSQQQLTDNQNHPKLTQPQLRSCQKIFQILDKDNKGYIIAQDLKEIEKTDKKIVNMIRKVFVRKQENSLFDFVYALWDSESMEGLVRLVEGG